MIYYIENPKIEDGVGVLFDTPEPIISIVNQMLGKVNIRERYLFISNMSSKEFMAYYRSVEQRCDELNDLMMQEKGTNTSVVSPKFMFLCHNLETCYLLKDYLQKLQDEEERVRYELAYHSTDKIVMTLDISEPL